MKSRLISLALLLCVGLPGTFALRAGPALAPTPEAIAPLAVGAVAPAVTLPTADGRSVDLGAAYRRKPTVLVFYKAGWCGLGARNLGQLHENRNKFDELGYQIIAVSTDKPEDLHPTRLKHGLTYTLLSDSGLTAAPAYGVAYRASPALIASYAEKEITLAPIPGEKNGARWLLVPTVFIVGRDGRVKWVYSSPQQNPALGDLVAAAEGALQ